MKASLVILACVLILAASAGAGSLGAARLRRRVDLLAGTTAGVDALMRDIDYLASPLAMALEQASRSAGAASDLFAAAGRRLSTGDGITGGEAWLAAVEEASAHRLDVPLLATVAAGLGETDARSQLRQLGVCRQQLAQGRREAEENYARFGKIWRAFGWCGGAVIILLLL